ncbi:MAG: TIGR00266 family protein [Cyanobacteria bacterium P01_H01_bin.121]
MSNIPYEIEHAPSYATLILQLKTGKTAIVEAGAMAAMDTSITMKSKMRGGLGKSLMRGVLGGESLFLSEFTAEGKPGQLYLSPGVPGDIKHYSVAPGRGLVIQSSGFIASENTVDLDTKWQGLQRGFFSGESFFLLHATGQGDVWFSSYGAILEVPVSGNYIVDNGYIVAFEDSLTYNVEVMGGLSFKGLKTAVLGGEGIVTRFQGEGKVWIQSRRVFSLINFLNAFRPVKSSD